MLGKNPQKQAELFRPMLEDFIAKKHELVLLGQKVHCEYFENEIKPLIHIQENPACPSGSSS